MFDDKTQIKDYFKNPSIKNMDTSDTQFNLNWFSKSFPVQMVCNKLAKNRGWQVMKMKTDIANRCFSYEVATSAKESEIRHITFDEMASDYGWKEWKFSDNGQELFYKKSESEEK